MIALDWDRLIPGHPGPGDRLGTKKDAQDGKCWDTAEKEFKVPGYESWPGYEAGLPFVARRHCGYRGRGT